MLRLTCVSTIASRHSQWLVTGLCLSLAVLALAANSRAIKKPTYDLNANVVELFDGIEQKVLDVTVIADNDLSVNIFFANKTDRPVTVKLPAAVAAVQVLKQQPGLPGQPGAANGAGPAQNGGQQAQPVGLGLGQPGQGNNQQGPGGNNNQPRGNRALFSIPAEKVVQLSTKGLCLAHGKPNPRPRLTYELARLETVNNNPALAEVIQSYARNDVTSPVAQAAVWHLADSLSWQNLAAKQNNRLGRPDTPYFTRSQIDAAKQLIEKAKERVAKRETNAPAAVSQR